ncbi:MAG TPA: protein kinase, partial [Terriglobales bacterium]|nr:protein kinase [Terriglobales bacterium]
MNCPKCGTTNNDTVGKCVRCGAALVRAGEAETLVGVSLPPMPAMVKQGAVAAPAHVPPPEPLQDSNVATAGPWAALGVTGSSDQVDFGPRYRIERLLGQGGMGAVYKAWDKELERPVALKLIKPGLALEAGVEARFKQELLLASKVSHRHILRIHDLGEAGGVKFISMAFVEGQDLHQLLMHEGKLPVERALKFTKQMCEALEEAHREGVVHRDFKPQNILLDKQENVYVSDFGLAKSLEQDTGMTKSGEFLGTPRYMAPEQVQGGKIDHRADLYALGLILYEMVSGDVPFHADTTLQLMYKRVHEVPQSPKILNPELPDWIVRVIMKCIERDPAQRYQSAGEILHDLETATAPPKSGSRSVQIALPGFEVNRSWLIVAAAVLLVASLVAIPSVRHRILGGGGAESSGPHKPVTVLVADFTNHTGDPVLDGTVEPMLNKALEGASFISAYSRESARKEAEKLPHPSNKLDEQSARLIAIKQSVNAVITGEITLRGGQYEVSAIVLDGTTGNVLGKANVSVSNKQDILHDLPELAAQIRKGLGDTTPPSVQLAAVRGSFSAASLEVVHYETVAVEQQFAGKYQEAFDSFKKASELDPSDPGPYSGLAASAGNLGNRADAEKYIKLALQHEDRMTERERYRYRGLYYNSVGNWQKCIDELSQLVEKYPSDRAGQTNLAVCNAYARNFAKATEVARRAVELVPKGAMQRVNLAFYLTYTGDFEGAEREARTALQINPSSLLTYTALAEAQLGKGQFAEVEQTYKKIQDLGAQGASAAASGLADLAAYEGRYADAIQILEQGATADLAAKDRDAAAEKLATLAHLQVLRGQKGAAVAAANKAVSISQALPVRVLAAQALIEAGEIAKALQLASVMDSDSQAEPQAYGKMIEGEAALARRDTNNAVKLMTEGVKLFDTWIGRFELGRAYVEAGQFVEADSEFDRCVKRKGEEFELFMDNVPTIAYLPPLYYYQGRVREGLKTPGFADSYRTYL